MSKPRWGKEIRRIMKIVQPFGITVEKGKKHNKLRDSEGRLLIGFSSTPSCPHWYKNIINDLIRRGYLPGVKKL